MASSLTKSEYQIRMDVKKEILDDLYDFLACQNCEAVPKEGAIYICDAGDHGTCNDCFQTSKVCKCKANIKTRSKGLEKARTTLPMACKNRKNGCNAVLTLDSLLYHEVDCQFRGIFCPILGCTKEVPSIIFKYLEDHLTEHHKDIRNENTSNIVIGFIVKESHLTKVKTNWVSNPIKLIFKNAQFFRAMVKNLDRFYIWIYYYGSPEEAKNYICTIKVFGGADDEYIYNGHPRSLDESSDEIIQEENALSLGVGQVKRIIKNNRLQCSITITCPKDEAKDEDVESRISDNDEKTTLNTLIIKKRKVSL
jgi:hypothetical protein